MSEIEIILSEKIDSVGSINKIEDLCPNIGDNVSKVVMNFKGVEFTGQNLSRNI